MTMTQPTISNTTTSLPEDITMAVLGDTFAINDVGERLVYSELLPHLVAIGESTPREQVTVLVSAREFIERYKLAPSDANEGKTVVALAPMVESAVDALREVLTGDEFGWRDCQFDTGLLEAEGMRPVAEGELRILLSPSGGDLASGSRLPKMAERTHHAVSHALAPAEHTVSEAVVKSALVTRSRSRDLLATVGLVGFLRRNPEVLWDLDVSTIQQVACEFPRAIDEGLFVH